MGEGGSGDLTFFLFHAILTLESAKTKTKMEKQNTQLYFFIDSKTARYIRLFFIIAVVLFLSTTVFLF